MTDHDALLRAVLESPADDAPRLVLADWLDEHGESERAEFIRLQVAGARDPNVIPGLRWRVPAAREAELFRRRWPRWLPADPLSTPRRRMTETRLGLGVRYFSDDRHRRPDVHFERGFLWCVRGSARWLLSASAARLFDTQPITTARAMDVLDSRQSPPALLKPFVREVEERLGARYQTNPSEALGSAAVLYHRRRLSLPDGPVGKGPGGRPMCPG
jgi:uncharacterized protein (TIGR02996 family)